MAGEPPRVGVTLANRNGRRLELTAGEVTGALGDSVTVLPLVVALGALTPLSVPRILLWFGVFQIVWGVGYGLPLSVEPMKALAGLAIAGVLGVPELLAAGLLSGGALLLGGRLGLLARLQRVVSDPLVRGIQLAVALVLARAAVDLLAVDPLLAGVGAAAVALVALTGRPQAGALVVLGIGGALAVAETGVPAPSPPSLALFPDGLPALSADVASGTLAQLATSVGNAAVATSLLCADLFDADVSADELAGSMGAMTLVAVPLGGLPMCHGSGGLAGKHAFGARTGGANLVLGALYLAGALVAGVVTAIPTALLGVVLVVVAVHLGRTAIDSADRPLTVGVGVLALLSSIGVAFVLGAVVDRLLARLPAEHPLRSR